MRILSTAHEHYYYRIILKTNLPMHKCFRMLLILSLNMSKLDLMNDTQDANVSSIMYLYSTVGILSVNALLSQYMASYLVSKET
jgi:hypothetical protein